MPATNKFFKQTLSPGLYEPEGIYLDMRFEDLWPIVQFWGENSDFYSQFKYNGIPVKGHLGLDFRVAPGTALLAVDEGRIMEISCEIGGFERYIKLEHRWGESFYAHIGSIYVESGQIVKRNERIGTTQAPDGKGSPHLHFGIRIAPYNRFDGWGGFTDPLPFLDSDKILMNDDEITHPLFEPSPMAIESPRMRRP
jgi:murein DD-endopeptidase MepM/ murein hydrolase activator NlpD